MIQTQLSLNSRNPDVLSCIANLSHDAVFTPPELANEMLDMLEKAWSESNNGELIWENSEVTFLDPCTKTGIFLREIVKRLVDGLEKEIPDLQKRVDHILTKQIFGIATETLTGLLARRSVYCSKYANGEHSIGKTFDDEQGNIWFERTEHTWVGGNETVLTADEKGNPVEKKKNGRCMFCGVRQREYDRDHSLESHAYAFIHSENIKRKINEVFGGEMKFDVVVGNPPYQLGSDGGTRDIPIYHKFVEQAKSLDPRMIMMVIPSRWMAGGLGLKDFRRVMLGDKSLKTLVDYPVAKEVFNGVEIKGGICYFLRVNDHDGFCKVKTVRDGVSTAPELRNLNEFDVFVRNSDSVKILRKVLTKVEDSITTILSVDKQFGWTSNFNNFQNKPKDGDVELHYLNKGKRSVGYIKRNEIKKSAELIDKWKVMVPKAGSDGGQRIPDSVVGKPHLAESPSVCTQTFLFFHTNTRTEAESIQSYYQTKFFRFLVSLRKITQDATRSTYMWVPIQKWDRIWTDEVLYEKYGLNKKEIDFIESMVRPMGVE